MSRDLFQCSPVLSQVYELVLMTLLDKCDRWDARWRTLCCNVASLLFPREKPSISFATDASHAQVALVAWLVIIFAAAGAKGGPGGALGGRGRVADRVG